MCNASPRRTAAAGTGSPRGSPPTSASRRPSSASAHRSDLPVGGSARAPPRCRTGARCAAARPALVPRFGLGSSWGYGMIDGLLVVDKPAGWTSHDVVAKLRGATRQRRIGHAGTLDPDATGVLLVGLGRVTRLLRYLQETTKAYRGEIAFGVATSTLDAAGDELARAEMPVGEDAVRAAMQAFVGDIEQVPPMVSALKVDGRRLHELAREGKEVERAPRPVRIDRYDLEAFEPGPFPRATVLVECSSGTYVRTLAADLGTALGGHAHLASLCRLRVGAFTLAEATELEQLLADPTPCVLSPADALRGMERIA